MTKSKIYNLNNDGAKAADERRPLTFADLEIGDVFRFADWHHDYPGEVSAIKWKVSRGVYARLTAPTDPEMETVMETGTVTAIEMAIEMETAEVVRYDLGLKLSNPQRYRED